MAKPDSRQLAIALGVAILLVCLLLYWAGLSGSFVLDDGPNLDMLNQLPPDPQWRDLWYAANSGAAGMLGRPLSLLSFVLQYEAWPDPFQFKLVNLLLHLANGVLLACLCWLLSRQLPPRHAPSLQLTVPATALIVFIWLAHPLQASTVFYVVQRMTELSTLFMLLGMCLYLAGRAQLQRARLHSGVALMLAGVFACGGLAVLSKESGALLLPYLVVLEIVLLRSSADTPVLMKTRRLLLYWPTLLGTLGFLLYLPVVLQGYDLKPFSMAERVLTQFPALLTYLLNAALVLPTYFGLFHDDFPLVTRLFQPWYALPAVVLVLSALVLGLVRIRQWPLFAFAVLWFAVGHALESTVLPLEPYFEHRNYLPLFGPVFALVVKLQQVLQTPLSARRRALLVSASGLVVLWMSVLTWQQGRLWGDEVAFALAAIANHPDSYRARSNLVETLSRTGQVTAAFDYHLSTLTLEESRITPYIRWLEFRCLLRDSPLPDRAMLATRAESAGHDYSAIFLLNNLVFGIIQNRCPDAPAEEVDTVLASLLANPAFAISAADLLQMQGFMAAGRGNFAAAAALAAQSFALREDVRVALYRTTWLLRAGAAEQARSELQLLETAYRDAIAASSDLTARYEFLRGELGITDP